jgi:hypothetical protein
MADVAASRVYNNRDDNDKTIARGYYDNYDGLGICGELRRGWTNTFRSRVSLIEEALTNCYTGDVGEDILQYDEDKARFLLRLKGNVDVVDFISDGVDPYPAFFRLD